jgi:hypothetical protein
MTIYDDLHAQYLSKLVESAYGQYEVGIKLTFAESQQQR